MYVVIQRAFTKLGVWVAYSLLANHD